MYTAFKYLQGQFKNGGLTKIPSGLTIQSGLTNDSTLNKRLGNAETSGLLCKTSIVKQHLAQHILQGGRHVLRHISPPRFYGAILWRSVGRERSSGRRKMIPVGYGTLNAVKNIQLELGLGHQAQFLPLHVLIWAVLFCWITRECAKKTCK